MAFIPEVFETCEQICEVEIAFTGNEMDFVVAGIVGEPYLADAINSELIEKAIYPIRDQMRMVGSAPLRRTCLLRVSAQLKG